MKKLLGWFALHKIFSIFLSVIMVLFLGMLGLRYYNLHIRGANKDVDNLVDFGCLHFCFSPGLCLNFSSKRRAAFWCRG